MSAATPAVPIRRPADWDGLLDDWDALAVRTPSPFATHEWLSAWWRAFGRGRRLVLTVRDADGSLSAAAVLARVPLTAAAPVNDHSGDWDVVARDDRSRREGWDAVARLPAPVVTLARLKPEAAAAARAALVAAGRRVHETPAHASPYLTLPDDPDALLRGVSRNLRSGVARQRRALERQGRLAFRTTTGGPELCRDLDALLRVEASGWKGRAGTAILSDPRTVRLYREFAHAAAGRGWLRLHLLELDGVAIAGDLAVAIGDTAFLVKTGFDEALARWSPGIVLRAEALRASAEEGLREYDFLGEPDDYKLRWTSSVRQRVTLRGFRGAAGVPAEVYRRAVRPRLQRGRERLRRGSR